MGNAYQPTTPEQDKPYEDLANAIIIQAVKDYRRALRLLQKDAGDRKALAAKCNVGKFFRSKWFGMLTTIDPHMLIRKLNEEER